MSGVETEQLVKDVESLVLMDVDEDESLAPTDEERVAAGEQPVVMSDPRVLVEVVDFAQTYGEGHRGVTAKQPFARGDHIQSELATVYVTHALPDDEEPSVRNFFLGRPEKPFEVCPVELLPLRGSLLIALTALMIRDHAELARLMIDDGPWALHGRLHTGKYATPYEAFPVASRLYALPAEWTLKEFGRLYAVVQLNAIVAYSPLTQRAYGAGIFAATSFFNHACNPNAIMVVRPGKLVIQAVQPIEQGEEITYAYKELPADLLSTNLVRTLHYEMGMDSSLGCRCNLCGAAEKAEETAILREGGNPENDRIVDMSLEQMWSPGTSDRLALDQKFMSFVACVIRDPNGLQGVAASDILRQQYEHFFLPSDAESKRPNPGYCADLAFVLGELYCTGLIHVPKQPPDNYVFWSRVYAEAVGTSQLNLPHSMSQALLARCYSHISAYAYRADEAERAADIEQFVVNFVSLRMVHGAMFGTTAYLSIIDKALPIVGDLSFNLRERISALEIDAKLHAATSREEGSTPPPTGAAAPTSDELLKAEEQAMEGK